MEAQTVMVVGGSGFIGQHVSRHLAARGHRVYATCGRSRPTPHLSSINWVPCDLRAEHATENWPKSCQAVVFLAQAREHRDFPTCRQEVFAVNVAGLNQALEYALRAKVERFIYASTGSICSTLNPLALETEPIQVAAERSYYVASKLAAEILLGPFASLLNVVTLRLFMPYGAGQKPDMLFPRLLDKVRMSIPIQLHGRDGLRANPVAVADVAEACDRCLTLRESTTMNVAGPDILTLRQIGTVMGRFLGRQPCFQVEDKDPPHIVGSTAHMREILHWTPQVRLEAGLAQWLRHEATDNAVGVPALAG